MGDANEVSAAEPDIGWSRWQPLATLAPCSAGTLAELLDGGQAFRWSALDGERWLGAWDTHVVQLRSDRQGRVQYSRPSAHASTNDAALGRYFGADREFSARIDALPWRSDEHLARCIAAFPGLRILRQPFGETLLCFLCSATKQIVQIKQMVALLAEKHGASILSPTLAAPQLPSAANYRLPTWPELARIPESALRSCLLGFRAKYIAETARFLSQHPGWLDETENLPYAQAKERLCSLPGVGEKVADCVLLFGAGRLEAFPVDVWILKTMAKRYGLEGWKPAQVAHFGRAHFGENAGLAQQFLFAWERRIGRGD